MPTFATPSNFNGLTRGFDWRNATSVKFPDTFQPASGPKLGFEYDGIHTKYLIISWLERISNHFRQCKVF